MRTLLFIILLLFPVQVLAGSDGDAVYYIKDGLNLGVGTKTPAALLEVNGAALAQTFNGAFIGNGALLTNLPSSAVAAAGSDKQIQFNSSNSFSASSNLVWNGTSSALEALRFRSMSDGSVGTPAFSFESDTDTGIYLSSGPKISFALGGSRKVDITNAGNVGIGDISPDAQLEVNGTTYSDTFAVDAGSTTTTAYSFWGDENTGVYSPSANIWAVVTGGSERVRVDGSGNVGIGETSPQTSLHLSESSASTTPDIEIEQLSSGDAGLQFSINGDSYAIGIDNSDSDKFKISYSSTAGSAVLGTNDRFAIDSDGSIEVGSGGTINNATGAGDLYVTSDLEVDGVIYGDGSGLTSLPSSVMAIDDLSDASSYTWSLYMGLGAGQAVGSDQISTGVGVNALNALTSGGYNTAIGTSAMSGVSTGSYNTSVGLQTLYNLTSGNDNTAIGHNVLYYADNGSSSNVAIGKMAGEGQFGGPYTTNYNVFIGAHAADDITTGSYNVILGYDTAGSLRSGAYNIIIGASNDIVSGTGSYQLDIGDTIFGNTSSKLVSIGTSTTDVGLHVGAGTPGTVSTSTDAYIAGDFEVNGTIYGNGSGLTSLPTNIAGIDDLSDGITDSTSVFLGTDSGLSDNGTNYATGVGVNSLKANSSGVYNTCFGYRSCQDLTTGTRNTMVGADAYLTGTTSDYNVAVGTAALGGSYNPDGNGNVAVGYRALYQLDEGFDNTAIGFKAGADSTYGNGNIFVGANCGNLGAWNLEVGRYDNICIGNNSCTTTSSYNNSIVIGHNIAAPSALLDIANIIYGDGTNIGIGDYTPTYKLDVNGTLRGYGITDSSDIRLKENIEDLGLVLDDLLNLRGIYYNWKDKDSYGEEKQVGFIAQEVENYFPELVRTDKNGYKSIAYGKMTAVLVQALKELVSKDDDINKRQSETIESLKMQNVLLSKQVSALEKAICRLDPSASFCN